MNRITSQMLLSRTWSMMDELRSEVFRKNYKSIIVPLLTTKFLFENHDHPFVLPENSLWSRLPSSPYIKDDLQRILNMLENENERLKGVLLTDALIGLNPDSLQMLVQGLNLFSMCLDDMEDPHPLTGTIAKFIDQLFQKFARDEGKSGAEYVTPISLNSLCAGLPRSQPETTYDGTCGIGGYLIGAARKSFERYLQVPQLFGQEINHEVWSLARMNMILHGLYDAQIERGNTLENPAFIKEGNQLSAFDLVLMNPPFSIPWKGIDTVKRDSFNRFRYGVPHGSMADMAFVQHAVASMNYKGACVMVLPHGPLFRGGNDAEIRKNLIQNDLIEAVIGLPHNLFIHTAIPVVLLILNSRKTEPGKVLFIKADEGFQKIDRMQNELRQEDIDRIISIYHDVKEEDNFSRLVSIDEIEKNDWSLNLARYFEVMDIESKLGKVSVSRNAYINSDSPKIRLGEIADVRRGVANAKELKGLLRDDDYRIINLSNVRENGVIDLNGLAGIEFADRRRASVHELNAGDVLISNRGASIKIAVVPEQTMKLVASSNFFIIRLQEGYDPDFLKAFLESPVGAHFLMGFQRGSAMIVLHPEDVKEILLPQLPLQIQQEIGRGLIKADVELKKAIAEAERVRNEQYNHFYNRMGIDKAID